MITPRSDALQRAQSDYHSQKPCGEETRSEDLDENQRCEHQPWAPRSSKARCAETDKEERPYYAVFINPLEPAGGVSGPPTSDKCQGLRCSWAVSKQQN